MTLDEIKAAVLDGRTVHWKNESYEVTRDKVGQWFIRCRWNDSLSGLTWADGKTMNEKPEDFYIATR